MRHRKLGNTDTEVPSVSLGTWVFGGECWGCADDNESIKVVREAVESGMEMIDTAPIYGGGRSEEVIGKALKGIERGRYKIATKCGLEKKGNAIRPNLSRVFIREEIDNSLRRLRTDHIDLYQCHWPDPDTPFSESFGELNRLKDEGKIKHIGVSNFSLEELKEAMSLAEIASNQIRYSIFDREPELEMIPFCQENSISILSYGSLGGGILTGKYREPRRFPKGDVRSFFYKYYSRDFWERSAELVSVLQRIAEEHSAPVSNSAINWVLRTDAVASCIAGCRNTAQLRSNVRAGGWSLSEKELSDIETVYQKAFNG
jgi:aryl-alcohol dehydrogenase-like predicted oxidoreductase